MLKLHKLENGYAVDDGNHTDLDAAFFTHTDERVYIGECWDQPVQISMPIDYAKALARKILAI
jgi:hypothetical protein